MLDFYWCIIWSRIHLVALRFGNSNVGDFMMKIGHQHLKFVTNIDIDLPTGKLMMTFDLGICTFGTIGVTESSDLKINSALIIILYLFYTYSNDTTVTVI